MMEGSQDAYGKVKMGKKLILLNVPGFGRGSITPFLGYPSPPVPQASAGVTKQTNR